MYTYEASIELEVLPDPEVPPPDPEVPPPDPLDEPLVVPDPEPEEVPEELPAPLPEPEELVPVEPEVVPEVDEVDPLDPELVEPVLPVEVGVEVGVVLELLELPPHATSRLKNVATQSDVNAEK
ncbi:MAG TPA: hypothetical protein VMU28_16445 [Terriglobales bacterium]|nr:hypothetical protein [Terriglobales bacterium]